MMNSSSEIVKDIRRLEMMPGVTNGKMTRKKVPSLFSPKSMDASSRLRSILLKADWRMAIEKGVQIRTWPIITVQADR